jgi:Uncharacterized conserved protein (DUF2278)
MPLDRYGVLVGTLHGHHRDDPDEQGRWFNVNLSVDAPAGRHRCAVDVDSKQSDVGVLWKVLHVDHDVLGPVDDLGPGYHDIASTPTSGAIDLVRHPVLRVAPGCVLAREPAPWLRRIVEIVTGSARWQAGSNLDAAAALEPLLVDGRRILVFGEPFTQGLGMHNIHQNQATPPGANGGTRTAPGRTAPSPWPGPSPGQTPRGPCSSPGSPPRRASPTTPAIPPDSSRGRAIGRRPPQS